MANMAAASRTVCATAAIALAGASHRATYGPPARWRAEEHKGEDRTHMTRRVAVHQQGESLMKPLLLQRGVAHCPRRSRPVRRATLYITRMLWALSMTMVIMGCAGLRAPLQGVSGPVAWQVTDLRMMERAVAGTARDLYTFTLVLQETHGATLTFTSLEQTISDPVLTPCQGFPSMPPYSGNCTHTGNSATLSLSIGIAPRMTAPGTSWLPLRGTLWSSQGLMTGANPSVSPWTSSCP